MAPDPHGFPALQQETREKLPEKATLGKVLYIAGGLLVMGAGGLAVSAGVILLTVYGMDLAAFAASFLGTAAMFAGYDLYSRSKWRHWQPHSGSNLDTLDKFEAPTPATPTDGLAEAIENLAKGEGIRRK